MVHAHCMLDTLGYKQSGYVILIAFPLQQWLHERAALLRYTHVACLVSLRDGCLSYCCCCLPDLLYVTAVSVTAVAVYRTYFTFAGNESQFSLVAIFQCYLSNYLGI
jgi:hypothetical protein